MLADEIGPDYSDDVMNEVIVDVDVVVAVVVVQDGYDVADDEIVDAENDVAVMEGGDAEEAVLVDVLVEMKMTLHNSRC